MVKILIGDLFKSESQTIVNTVNCVGVMGKGVALEAKRRFPAMYQDYVERCEYGQVRLGEPYLFRYLTPPWILNFPTKDHWRSVTHLDDITRGLDYLNEHYREWGITSLAVPPLGCGNGQLEWRIVGPTLYRYLSKLEIPVELYAPYDTPHGELLPDFLDHETHLVGDANSMPDPQWIRPEWVAVAEIMKRIEDQPYHWPIGRTIFQKIAYTATREGLKTGLKFSRNSYGPYSPDLKRLESRLVNNGLIRIEQKSNGFSFSIGPTYEAAFKAYGDDIEWWDSLIEKIVDLFVRVNADQAEIIATVMFAADELAESGNWIPTERAVLEAVMDWKTRRKPPIKEEDVSICIRDLAALGWLRVTRSVDLPLPADEFAFA